MLQRLAEGLGGAHATRSPTDHRRRGGHADAAVAADPGRPAHGDFGSLRRRSLEEFPFEEQVGNSLVVREPVGVVGCITPWNYPLHQIAAKVAPALAAGCTVVLKPSEVAPLNAFILAEIIDEVGPARRACSTW